MSVGVSRSGKTELCLWNQWRRSTVNISDDWWEGFWLRITASVQGASITSGRCSKMARRLTPPETIDVKMSFIEQNMTLWPPNNPDLNLVEYAVWGVLQEMVYQCRSFKSARTTKCNSRCVATTVTSVPWTKYQRMAASPWKRSTV